MPISQPMKTEQGKCIARIINEMSMVLVQHHRFTPIIRSRLADLSFHLSFGRKYEYQCIMDTMSLCEYASEVAEYRSDMDGYYRMNDDIRILEQMRRCGNGCQC